MLGVLTVLCLQLQEASGGYEARHADPVRGRLYRDGDHLGRPLGRHSASQVYEQCHSRVSLLSAAEFAMENKQTLNKSNVALGFANDSLDGAHRFLMCSSWLCTSCFFYHRARVRRSDGHLQS